MKQFILTLCVLLSGAVLLAQCETLTGTITFTNPTCFGFSDGVISVGPDGGTAPYEIEITDSEGELLNPDLGAVVNTLEEGWYYILIRDNIECEWVDSVELIDMGPTGVSFDHVDPSGPEICDGVITTTVTGEYESLNFLWDPNPSGSTGPVLTDACYGNYIVIITSDAGCTVFTETFLAQYLSTEEQNIDPFKVQRTLQGVEIYNPLSQGVEVNFYNLNGQLIFNKKLNTGSSTINSKLPSGIYIYTIFDANGQLQNGKIQID